MWKLNISKFVRDARGSFAMMTAFMLFVLLIAVGVVVDYGRIQSFETKSQNVLDGATLAAARYMSDTLLSGDNETTREKGAKEVAADYVASMTGSGPYQMDLSNFVFSENEVTVTSAVSAKPYFAHMFGVKSLDLKVASSATIAGTRAKDVDVVLIADITGSMATTLTAVQDNMKTFTWDLSSRLSGDGIKLGQVRVQFIFYRDYTIDNHQDWTGPHMTPVPGLEMNGSMYISKFYEVPAEKNAMDTYVDYFVAAGGGSYAESGLETVWHALNTDWGVAGDTVRSVVLWTDAPARNLHDKTESSLAPYTSSHIPPAEPYWWSNEYFEQTMGSAFAAMTKEQREDYMYSNYYPADMPTTIDAIKSTFADFHAVNSNNVADVKSMAINIINSSVTASTYPVWSEMGTWEGVDVIASPPSMFSTETYDKILDEVVEMVTSQIIASEAVITH